MIIIPLKQCLFIKLCKSWTNHFYTAAVTLLCITFWFNVWRERRRGAEEESEGERGKLERQRQRKSINTLVNESQLFTPCWASQITDCVQDADCGWQLKMNCVHGRAHGWGARRQNARAQPAHAPPKAAVRCRSTDLHSNVHCRGRWWHHEDWLS